jgi:hypothetical protein
MESIPSASATGSLPAGLRSDPSARFRRPPSAWGGSARPLRPSGHGGAATSFLVLPLKLGGRREPASSATGRLMGPGESRIEGDDRAGRPGPARRPDSSAPAVPRGQSGRDDRTDRAALRVAQAFWRGPSIHSRRAESSPGAGPCHDSPPAPTAQGNRPPARPPRGHAGLRPSEGDLLSPARRRPGPGSLRGCAGSEQFPTSHRSGPPSPESTGRARPGTRRRLESGITPEGRTHARIPRRASRLTSAIPTPRPGPPARSLDAAALVR